MGPIASQITSITMVYSIVYSDADQRKHQSSASLAFVRWIHRGPVYSPHKWPVTRKMFPFDDVIMQIISRPFGHNGEEVRMAWWGKNGAGVRMMGVGVGVVGGGACGGVCEGGGWVVGWGGGYFGLLHRHYQHMRNQKFYASDKRPMVKPSKQ